MKQYLPAVGIVSVLLITQIFLLLNLTVFVNLYKTYKRQKDYFIRLLLALVAACVMDFFVYINGANTVGYAIATLISCLLWLGLNTLYFPYMKPNLREILYIAAMLGVYILLSFTSNYLIRIALYFLAYLVITKIVMDEEWKYALNQLVLIKNKIRGI